jgi:hypothetical protein
MSNVARAGRGLRILGISLALLNLLLWFCVPAIRAFVDETTGRRVNPRNLIIMTGVQELLVYFDPWLARRVFPIVYIFGLAAIPFLKKPSAVQTGSLTGLIYAVIVSLLLVTFEFIWLFLTAVGVFLRGPNWNLFWPGEEWDEYKIEPWNNINLSDYFWFHWMDLRPHDIPWVMRESPGLILIGSYLLTGFFLAYVLFRYQRRATPYWRWIVLVLMLQLAALVPFKMMCRWVFNVKYWIYLPEYDWNV